MDSKLDTINISSLSTTPNDKKISRIKVSECFSATEAVTPFFRNILSTIHRDDVLQQNKIRDLVIEYANAKVLLCIKYIR